VSISDLMLSNADLTEAVGQPILSGDSATKGALKELQSQQKESENQPSAIESMDMSSIGGAIGGVAGSLFGPAGAAIGSQLGSIGGTLATKANQVPRGPGATIESGAPATVSGFAPSSAALSAAQSLQHLAVKGVSMKSVVSGFGKVF